MNHCINFEHIDADDYIFADVDPFAGDMYQAKPLDALDIPSFDDGHTADVLDRLDLV